MLYEVITLYGVLTRLYGFGKLFFFKRVDGFLRVITSYSIHYTKLYDTLLTAALNLSFDPYLLSKQYQLLDTASQSLALDNLLPDRFQSSPDGNRVFYVGKIARDHSHLRDIFVAEQANNTNET